MAATMRAPEVAVLRSVLRGLVHEPGRAALSVLAVAAAVALVLVFEGFERGLYRQIHAFAAGMPADLIAMQPGVSNILGARSVLPQSARAEVEAIPGVATAHPLAGLPVIYSRGDDITPVYVIGYDTAGGPATLVAGRSIAREREIVIDATLAARYGFGPDSEIEFLGQRFTIAGLSGGTTNPFNPYVYVRLIDLVDMLLRGDIPEELAQSSLSFFLVELMPGWDVATVRSDIGRLAPSVAVFTPAEVAANDVLRTKGFMGSALALLIGSAHVVAVLVVGLTMYVAVLGRRREFGIMKALGARSGWLARLVLVETLVVCGLAFAVALPSAFGLAWIVGWAAPQYAVTPLDPSVLGHTAAALLVVAALGAIAPFWQIAQVDPATAFGQPT